MKLCQSVQIMFVCCIVFVQKCRHACVDILRQRSCNIRYDIPAILVFSDRITVRNVLKHAAFQLVMISFNQFMRKRLLIGFQHFIEHQKVTGHFLDVFCANQRIFRSQGAGIEQRCRLLFR